MYEELDRDLFDILSELCESLVNSSVETWLHAFIHGDAESCRFCLLTIVEFGHQKIHLSLKAKVALSGHPRVDLDMQLVEVLQDELTEFAIEPVLDRPLLVIDFQGQISKCVLDIEVDLVFDVEQIDTLMVEVLTRLHDG